jgi:hypothetical protein
MKKFMKATIKKSLRKYKGCWLLAGADAEKQDVTSVASGPRVEKIELLGPA